MPPPLREPRQEPVKSFLGNEPRAGALRATFWAMKRQDQDAQRRRISHTRTARARLG